MYSNYTTLPPANLVIGSLPVSVQIGTCGGNYTHSAAIWIDLNQNGSFENPAERVFLSGTGAGPFTHSGNLVIPSTATLGITGMRVVNVETGTPANITPCGTYTWGETEDYLVNIQPCVPVTAVTNPTTFTTQCSGNVSLTASAGSASFPSWAWEMRVNASSPWQNAVAGGLGGVIVSANTNVLQLSGVPSSLNGYQFRPVVVNPCTAIDFGQTATLSVTPLVATVTPTSSTICAGSIIPLTLTNTTSPTTVSFPASAGLPLNIPDNNPTGVLSNLTVAGIPAGAAITEVRMTFNMTHTWVGDMVLNLRAPNGQVINLIGLLDGGSGSNGTANFTNTTVSSDNTRPAMSGAPAPRNGIFRADRYSATVPSLLPTTTSLWGNLVPNGAAANGTWTLGLCDLGPADVGVLQSWTITITYGAPAAGIWSATPAAPNTMWLNAAGTIPYDGSAQNTIYVNPAVNSTYCVVYSTATPACTSGPTCIPVNVVNPIGGSSTVANRTVCVGGTTSFSTSPTGGPFTFQWQESRDNGLTWNNVSNNALYGGATTSTLTLTGVTRSAPLDMNNFLYRCNINTAPCGGVVTTNAGLLTVNALPAVTISATDLALLPNQTTTITASSNPAAGGAPNWAWTRNGAPIANSTGSQSVNIDQLGVYQVSVTDVNGCRNSSNQLLIEAENSDKLWLYPNPTSGAFQVRLWYSGVTTEKRRIQVFNSAGAEVMSRDIDLSSVTSPRYQRIDIDLGFMPGGVYLVRVIDLYSKKSKSGFVIKQTK
jgi:subtilisin-like proprotein convertase family protein